MPNAKILVVDDEPNIIELVAAYLRREGYEVFTAADGPSGLKAARALKPDLIVPDVMLPGMDGLEVLTRLRRESEAYVILLTARSEETDKIVGLAVGADDYLTKPFNSRELVARVKAALRRMHAGSGDASVLAFRHVRIDLGSRRVHNSPRVVEHDGQDQDVGQPEQGNDVLRRPADDELVVDRVVIRIHRRPTTRRQTAHAVPVGDRAGRVAAAFRPRHCSGIDDRPSPNPNFPPHGCPCSTATQGCLPQHDTFGTAALCFYARWTQGRATALCRCRSAVHSSQPMASARAT